jgi:hypothetical protein
MVIKRKASFNPKSFLAKVGEGRSIGDYRKDQIVFSQGDPADAVFYLQNGKAKVTADDHGPDVDPRPRYHALRRGRFPRLDPPAPGPVCKSGGSGK